ncbi:hypothetical protein CSA_023685, partial [Cucumis sativus]
SLNILCMKINPIVFLWLQRNMAWNFLSNHQILM